MTALGRRISRGGGGGVSGGMTTPPANNQGSNLPPIQDTINRVKGKIQSLKPRIQALYEKIERLLAELKRKKDIKTEEEKRLRELQDNLVVGEYALKHIIISGNWTYLRHKMPSFPHYTGTFLPFYPNPTAESVGLDIIYMSGEGQYQEPNLETDRKIYKNINIKHISKRVFNKTPAFLDNFNELIINNFYLNEKRVVVPDNNLNNYNLNHFDFGIDEYVNGINLDDNTDIKCEIEVIHNSMDIFIAWENDEVKTALSVNYPHPTLKEIIASKNPNINPASRIYYWDENSLYKVPGGSYFPKTYTYYNNCKRCLGRSWLKVCINQRGLGNMPDKNIVVQAQNTYRGYKKIEFHLTPQITFTKEQQLQQNYIIEDKTFIKNMENNKLYIKFKGKYYFYKQL